MKKTDIAKGNKIIHNFYIGSMRKDPFIPQYEDDWNELMRVVEKIEKIIGHSISINYVCEISWWYNIKKTTHLGDLRTPFDSIGGKYYNIIVGFSLDSPEKIKAETRILAVWTAVIKFIEWYNKKVKTSAIKRKK